MRIVLIALLLALCSGAYSEQSPKGADPPAKKEQVKSPAKDSGAKPIPTSLSEPKSAIGSAITEAGRPVDDCYAKCGEYKPDKDWWQEFRTDPVATFTGLLFLATIALWWATLRLVNGAEKTAERQLRAYMAIDFGAVLLNSPSAGSVTAWLRFKNFGITPAYKLKGWKLFHRKTTNEMPFDQSGEFENEAIIAPGGAINLSSTLTISTEQLQAIKDQTISFFVWGRVEYIDVFKENRYFTFKSIMNGPTETVVVDGVRAEGWGLRPIPNGFDAN